MPVEISGAAEPGPAPADFWRTPAANGALPDGTTDVSEPIARTGPVGIGLAAGATPVSGLDVAVGGRSGVHGNVASSPLYVTGVLPPRPAFNTPGLPTPVGMVEARHSNGSQGVGLGFNVIASTGSAASQDLMLLNRGGGFHIHGWQGLNSGSAFHERYVGEPIDGNFEGWQERWYAGGAQEFTELRRRITTVGGGLGNEHYWQGRNHAGGFVNMLRQSPLPGVNAFCLNVNPTNAAADGLLSLFGDGSANPTAIYGFGIKPSTLSSQIPGAASFWRWFVGGNAAPAFSVAGTSVVTIDPGGLSGGVNGVGAMRFGSEAATEFITSQRTGAGPNLNGLSFGTANAVRMVIKANGRINLALASIPSFLNDAAAGLGGLVAGDLYRVPLGIGIVAGNLAIKL